MPQVQTQEKKDKPKFFGQLISEIIGSKEEEKNEDKLLKEPGEPVDKSPKRLIIDAIGGGVESNYYWLVRFMENKEDFGLKLSGDNGEVIKLRDLFSAGESSSLWGSVEQRKSVQQEKISGYLATIGKLIKDLFQIVRELRILDERLSYYEGYNKGNEGHSVSLKSVWVDLVEGGSKNPGSVTGLASQVGFVILPDLFYRIHPNPKTSDKVEEEIKKAIDGFKIEKYSINSKVIEVLKRKLVQFLEWKVKTEKELTTRKSFTLKYLRQHYNVIRLYINWLKPYLKNVSQLQMGSSLDDVHLVSSFETSKVDLELLGKLKKYTINTQDGYEVDKEFKKYFPCVHVKVRFVALPEMSYQKEYQRGAIHIGRTEIYIQGYVATLDQINAYKKKIDKEDLELIESLNESLNAMGGVLQKYLDEAEEKNLPLLKEDVIKVMEETGVKKDKAVEALKNKKGDVNEAIKSLKDSKPQDNILDPFKAVLDGFKEILNIKTKPEKALPLKKEEESEKKIAQDKAKGLANILYLVYKKSHGMITEL